MSFINSPGLFSCLSLPKPYYMVTVYEIILRDNISYSCNCVNCEAYFITCATVSNFGACIILMFLLYTIDGVGLAVADIITVSYGTVHPAVESC
jgi:hypothetical protein